jgi:deoxyguanosine kinase
MYIAIEGVIGVGKTTLARMLSSQLDADLQLEVFEENPFLADFYSNRDLYAFQTQIFFLLSRFHQQRKSIRNANTAGTNLVTDYTFAKDSLFAQINLSGDELDTYFQVHEALKEKVILPDLVVYLKADTDVLLRRITQRDRTFERNMDKDYIHKLNLAYNNYFERHHQNKKLLTINTNTIDFVVHNQDFISIKDQIEQELKTTIVQDNFLFDKDNNAE